MKKVFLFLALSLLGIGNIDAQNTDNAKDYSPGSVVRIMPDGTDSIFQNVKILIIEDKLERQQRLVYLDQDGQRVELTPYEAKGYHSKQAHTYISINIKKADGSEEKVFAQSKYSNDKEMPNLYKVYDSKNTYRMYMGQEGETMQLMTNPDDPTYGNKLIDRLLELNQQNGGNDEIERYINSTKPTRRSISNRVDLIHEQNPNKIPRWRWGVGTGINLNSLTLRNRFINNSMGTQCQWKAHVFGEYRSRFGIGAYTELSFLKASCMQDGFLKHDLTENTSYFTTYNKTCLTLPIMLRYTMVQLRGKWLPFAEFGVQICIDLKDKCDDIRLYENTKYYEPSFVRDKYETAGSQTSLVGGLGVEYRLSRRHSLIFDARYCGELDTANLTPKFTMPISTFSFNLSFSF